MKNIETNEKIAMETANLVTFTKEMLKGKLHFLCSENYSYSILMGNTENLENVHF